MKSNDLVINKNILLHNTIRQGIRDAFPLAIGIATYGIPYGVLGIHAGFGVLGTVAMSALVFSGSVQMISIAMHTAGAGLVSIIGTAVLLNLRNLLYGATLASGISTAKKWRWLLAFGVSDEPFVLGTARFQSFGPDPLYFGIITIVFYLTWVATSFIGAIIGGHINTQDLGLDLAFPMTFVAILSQIIKDKPIIATALTGAIITIANEIFVPGSPYVILLAGFISPFVGCYLRSRKSNVE
ncbi:MULTISPECIES: AzlC family ABC transporter permease [Bacillales]|uniref:AzlC family protein n=1 Tax=Anoxybacteroides amylolyticum TaxID=294699 RepID=A0A160F2R4_9BACL|nr:MULTISPECIES: AzlC family ABC transporter permease [Bacillaceae]ANB60042.1 azlC family protein [Anoxybacillus amylolyticus]